MREQIIEYLSEQVHNAWWDEKKKQGFHAPDDCKCYDPDDVKHYYWDKFETHCSKCHTDMYPYDELPENIKDYDRVTVKAVLGILGEIANPELAYLQAEREGIKEG